MKGRRKAKTAKWFLIEQYKEKARHVEASDNQRRFLQAAQALGHDLEPTGPMSVPSAEYKRRQNSRVTSR